MKNLWNGSLSVTTDGSIPRFADCVSGLIGRRFGLSAAPRGCVSLAAMDARQALTDLQEISPQLEAAVIFGEGGDLEASTLADEESSREVARLGGRLLDEAGFLRSDGSSPVSQVHARLGGGNVFVVREAGRSIAAVSGGEPTVGLVFYDLRSALRSLEGETDAA